MSDKKRRNFTPDEKVAILRKSPVENVAVSNQPFQGSNLLIL